MDSQTSHGWGEFIRSACVLWLRLSATDRDRAATSTGTEVHYAVDTDLIKLYAAPFEHRRYADILGVLDEQGITTVARCLSHYIFFGAPGRNVPEPSYLVPPLDEELLGVYAAVRRDAAAEAADARVQVVEIFNALRKALRQGGQEQIVEQIQKHQALLNVLFGDRFTGRINELDRMNKLFREHRLKPIAKDARFPVPDTDDLKGRAEDWFVALRRFKNKTTSTLRIARDADALAYIEWVNSKQQNIQLRFITGDESLHRLAMRDRGKIGVAAQSIIRDPRIFLSELLITTDETASHQTYNIRDWLRVFLAPLSVNDDLDADLVSRYASTARDELRSTVEAVFEQHHGSRRLNEAREEWREFARQTSLVYGIRIKSDTDVASNLVKLIWSADADQFRRSIDSHVIRILGDLSASSAVAGLFLTAQKSHKFESLLSDDTYTQLPSRMPIAIRFKDLEAREQYLGSLAQALESKDIDQINKLKEAGPGYTGHLLYALFFAALGDWPAAGHLARVANLLSAEARQRSSDEMLVDNEAAFFLAVALRHSSRNLDDLLEAINELDTAEEKQRTRYDARFASERIAQYLFVHHYLVFLPPPEPDQKIPKVPSLLSCLDRLQALLHEVRVSDEGKEIKTPLLRQIATNILITFLLLKHKLRLGEQRMGDVASDGLATLTLTIEEFKKLTSVERSLYHSHFVDTILAIAKWSLESDKAKKTMLAVAAKQLCNEALLMRQMPYDNVRFRFYLSEIERDEGDVRS